MRITNDGKGGLFIRADLRGEDTHDGESRIERGKYRAFSNAVHSAIYAAPKRGVRIKPSYSIATNDQTGEVTCNIPANGAAEAMAVLHYLSATPVRASMLSEG
jgi:hypothetical protein